MTCYSTPDPLVKKRHYDRSLEGLIDQDAYIKNRQYQYSRDEAVTNTAVPIVQALPHGSYRPAFVGFQGEVNGVVSQSSRIDMPRKKQRGVEYGGIGKKASPVRLSQGRGGV